MTNLTSSPIASAPGLHPGKIIPPETELTTARWLHRTLVVDGGGALSNALLLLLAPTWASELVGAPESFLLAVALILLGFCAAIGKAAWSRPLREPLVLLVIVLNVLWVIGSLSSAGELELTNPGRIIWIGQTLFVAGITGIEAALLARLRSARKDSV